mgnify:FL=1
MFLARTAFWLGLTFTAMHGSGEAPASAARDAVTGAATRFCAGNVETCLKAAGAAGALAAAPAKAVDKPPVAKNPAKAKADPNAEKAPGRAPG